MNTTVATGREIKPIDINTIRPILSAGVYVALITFLSYTILVVAVIGIVSNSFVIITCSKIGFSETINISYLALGISDLMVSVTRTWGALCFIFVVTNTKLPFDPASVSITTAFYLGQGFEKTTAFITGFIAMERCICVQFPLHVKTMVTKRRTTLSITMIYLFVFGPANLSYIAIPFRWVFSTAQNKTILAAIPAKTPLDYIIAQGLLVYHGTIIHFTALIFVWICTTFLAVGLNKKAVIRKENFNHTSAKDAKQKERHVIKTVFLLAVTYLVCSTPTAATVLVPHFVPEFTTARALGRISLVCHLISALFTQLNSSANLFIFIYMTSKFRRVFWALFVKRSS
ncbi:chemosensory receptor a [Plakobranchus ocellatus]|uniref:Chemosensory receptor a n=1 Tax=Plakobranchus ocellatus TaxID=259542 RepID=A0AAV4DNR5_9GAST|nr:chemosensory receptor a [Plakobranchus ocellatus]